MDQENASVIQEIASPEQQDQPVSQAVEETQPAAPVEDPQERNWREIRQSLKELKRENQYLRQQVESSQQRPVSQEEPEDDEPYVTPKKLNKQLSDFEQRLKMKEAETVEDRLRSKYNDYDDVVSVENVEYLKQNDPELALSIQALAGDPYKQASAAYKLLKKTDYYMNKNTMQDKAKIADNSKKPMSVQAVRKQGALGEANRFANGLTPELKKALFAEMQAARKGA